MKQFDPDIHHRRSIRLRDFDYAAAGAYFVTICVQRRECLFGDVVEEAMILNDAGRMIEATWRELPNRYPGIEIDVHMVMPDHFHGIIWIVGAGPRACPDSLPDRAIPKSGHPQGGDQVLPDNQVSRAGTRPAPTLGDVIGAFKSLTTNAYIRGVEQNHWPPFPGRLWQRNYFERIIRDDDELRQLRDYVAGNPGRWAEDAENPVNNQTRAGTRPAPTRTISGQA